MFGGLKEKLQAARSRLGSSTSRCYRIPQQPAGTGTAQQVSVPEKEGLDPPLNVQFSTILVDKFKVLVIGTRDDCFGKDISDALSELELDPPGKRCTLPATDAIICACEKKPRREAP